MIPAIVGCDLDGVVWRGDEPIVGAAAAVADLRYAGARVVFVTNNSSATVAEYLAKLGRHGIPTTAADLVTSARVAAHWLRAQPVRSHRVLACAGPGVLEALSNAGFAVVTTDDDDVSNADAVVVGWHQTFDFAALRVAADVIRGGARYVATNTDPTYPGPGGTVLPGNGSLVAAVTTASGMEPTVVGKPYAPMADYVRALLGSTSVNERCVMIGDRVSTDGAFAETLGWPFALVLSGTVGADDGEAVPDPPPAFVAPDLRNLVDGWLNTR